MKRPEITWSILHPTPLDPDYVRRLMEIAKHYTVDSIEICGQCHTPYGGLDGLIRYEEYPQAFASWNQALVTENQTRMNEIIDIAHGAGKEVYYFHREVMLPMGLLKDIPELLDENGEFNLLGDAFAKLISYKVEKTFQAVPGLDGIVLTLTEADFSAIHNSHADVYPPVKVVEFMIRCFAQEFARRGKRFIMRSFGSIAKDYEDILAGAELVAKDLSFEIETKITPYDFDPYLPRNPFLKRIPGLTLSAECECVGEFMGQGNLPFEHIQNLVKYVREGQAVPVDRYAIRMDRRGNCIFDVYEQNYYAYSRALENPTVTAEQVREEWAEKHYPPQYREAFLKLDKLGWEVVTRNYFIDHQVMFHGNYALKYLKAGFVFPLFRKGESLENASDIWSILTDRPSPGRDAVVKEKEEAVALAQEGLALYSSLHAPVDYRHRLWCNAVTVTQANLAMTKAIAAYFEDMEAGRDEPTTLLAAVKEALRVFDTLAGHRLAVQTRQVINGLEHRVNEVNRTIEEICLEPFAAICKALPDEYLGERAVRRDFIAGVVDGIACGGIYDDIRIHRYMHGSHALLHNGYPARWAGNRVFPNGFFDFRLKRGHELIIYGDPEVRDFALVCDGVRQCCSFDGNGQFRKELPQGSEKVEVRLEKNGRDYPLFFAVVTRD